MKDLSTHCISTVSFPAYSDLSSDARAKRAFSGAQQPNVEVKAEVNALARKLAEAQNLADVRLKEVVTLSKMVLELEEKIQAQQKATAMRAQNKLKKRFWKFPLSLVDKNTLRQKEEVLQLERSSLFDSDWYLRQYADVRESGINPALHYLKFGAKEGRDPGPDFRTLDYVKKNANVLSSGENPLLHYLKTHSPTVVQKRNV